MAAQREVGVQLPPELVASPRRHDGAGGDLLFLDGARLGLRYGADDVTFDGSYVELLEETADALTGGGEYRPVVVDGVLNWE